VLTVQRACIALALIGCARIAWFHFAREPLASLPAAHRTLIDARYDRLRALLPPEGRIGYLSDLPLESDEGSKLYDQAVYSLAPRLLVKDDGRAPFVVVNLRNPSAETSIIDRSLFASTRDLGDGILLLERAAR
jgi:hypothetical protein